MNAELEQKLRLLTKVFLEENEKVNLSALRTEENCWVGNILDSLGLLDVLPRLVSDTSKISAVDVGTGGGFPLLPLALAIPEGHFTGIDATKKKIDAVARIVKKIGIPNVSLTSDRTETLGHAPKLREHFTMVTCRAVDTISTDLEYCSPFCKSGGMVILWKSMNIQEELEASRKAQEMLHCTLEMLHPYKLPDPFGTRQLLIFRKTATLDKGFPRTIGLPKKRPL